VWHDATAQMKSHQETTAAQPGTLGTPDASTGGSAEKISTPKPINPLEPGNRFRWLAQYGKLALTRVEAAAALGIHVNSLDRLVARQLLHPSRALRRPLFPVRELERFLEETT